MSDLHEMTEERFVALTKEEFRKWYEELPPKQQQAIKLALTAILEGQSPTEPGAHIQ